MLFSLLLALFYCLPLAMLFLFFYYPRAARGTLLFLNFFSPSTCAAWMGRLLCRACPHEELAPRAADTSSV